ncbi:type II toxin-antitoxin system HicA family toxin [Clostridium sp. Mt-5]|uniref:Type II toxin-antitoxin system HicA family toxin n=1 Tax=Clostridium moutaii TaxID=3240932 RepID=A0ABV4BLV6_9CLOT
MGKKFGLIEVRQSGSHKFFTYIDGRCTVIPVHGKDFKRGLNS